MKTKLHVWNLAQDTVPMTSWDVSDIIVFSRVKFFTCSVWHLRRFVIIILMIEIARSAISGLLSPHAIHYYALFS